MPRKSPYKIVLTRVEKEELELIARKYTSAYYRVVRAKIVLYTAQGFDNDEIGRRLNLPRQIVSKWRKRFFEHRLEGLEDEPRQGRPPVFFPSGSGPGKGSCL
jgi:DNA-binding CsgD family transcriptional regulator